MKARNVVEECHAAARERAVCATTAMSSPYALDLGRELRPIFAMSDAALTDSDHSRH
jgi:hypothetical protein